MMKFAGISLIAITGPEGDMFPCDFDCLPTVFQLFCGCFPTVSRLFSDCFAADLGLLWVYFDEQDHRSAEPVGVRIPRYARHFRHKICHLKYKNHH